MESISNLHQPSLEETPTQESDYLLAYKIGLKESVIVQKIQNLLSDLSNIRTLDGIAWIRKTYDELLKEFPFFSKRTLRRTILKLEKAEILRSTSVFNESKFDRSKFYTLNLPKLKELLSSEDGDMSFKKQCSKLPNLKLAPSSGQVGPIESSKLAPSRVPPKKPNRSKVVTLNTIGYVYNNINNYLYIYKNNNNYYLPPREVPTRTRPDSEQEAVVVVFEKMRSSGIKISESQLRKWIEVYGTNYVSEKIDLTKSSNPRSLEKFLYSALKFDWKAAENVSTKPQRKEKMPSMKISDRHKSWFLSLPEDGKKMVLADVCHAFQYYQNHLDYLQVDIFDPEFINHRMFEVMVETLTQSFPGKYKL